MKRIALAFAVALLYTAAVLTVSAMLNRMMEPEAWPGDDDTWWYVAEGDC